MIRNNVLRFPYQARYLFLRGSLYEGRDDWMKNLFVIAYSVLHFEDTGGEFKKKRHDWKISGATHRVWTGRTAITLHPKTLNRSLLRNEN
jgi:hypothetical protein